MLALSRNAWIAWQYGTKALAADADFEATRRIMRRDRDVRCCACTGRPGCTRSNQSVPRRDVQLGTFAVAAGYELLKFAQRRCQNPATPSARPSPPLRKRNMLAYYSGTTEGLGRAYVCHVSTVLSVLALSS